MAIFLLTGFPVVQSQHRHLNTSTYDHLQAHNFNSSFYKRGVSRKEAAATWKLVETECQFNVTPSNWLALQKIYS